MKEILRSLREKNNYSQSAVAAYLEISRQMYNKYEMGTAEPSLKNIRKLCELYKVSADVFFHNQPHEASDLPEYNVENLSGMYISSPVISYGSSETNENTNKLLSELISLLPLLHLNEQISLMSRLAAIIEKQTCNPQESPVKTKKIKKIPDAEYNKYLNSAESEKIRNASLSAIREMLKNDQW